VSCFDLWTGRPLNPTFCWWIERALDLWWIIA
jgi:hypothetical protein